MFESSPLPLNKREILRYLGYKRKQELTPAMEQTIEELMLEVQTVAQPRYSFQIFDCQPLPEVPAIQVVGTDLILKGKSIYNHLKSAEQVVLLAATLGIEVERRIRQYELTELSKSLILDACCTEYIEKICDFAECEIANEMPEAFMNRRFSPGYGDLPLATQPDFFAVLEADKKLGIHLSSSLLMIPRKSITAIIGLFADEAVARPRRKGNTCKDCSMQTTCNYRR
ncbi:hypothetical protein M2139_002743 [Enterococcus sp. PF1-24]|uniref:vitamin B12 dependent-methionine synthase activation domain-containing protein n=1 Tax=unclassified Enterococcus TaxID=2608891 RepID=UPI002473E3CF|nr:MULTISPECIES: vitamin B12 dependent-methionine synthase activation domain-containing protein [unclassified Enterococcus]MDH6365714.1 hypothetical protein [Enterococcus sp. PFB1-1]MDH6402814.1 hypothetical protein [Enterococcus sp. PF1-24]